MSVAGKAAVITVSRVGDCNRAGNRTQPRRAEQRSACLHAALRFDYPASNQLSVKPKIAALLNSEWGVPF